MTAQVRSYRIRFKPTATQAEVLTRSFGAARWAWNVGLEMISGPWKERRERLTYVNVSKRFTVAKALPEFEWLNVVPSDVIGQSLHDLDTAYRNFFAKRVRYPRRKKFGSKSAVCFALDPHHKSKQRLRVIRAHSVVANQRNRVTHG